MTEVSIITLTLTLNSFCLPLIAKRCAGVEVEVLLIWLSHSMTPIFINSVTTTKFKVGILELNILDQFPKFLCGGLQHSHKRNKKNAAYLGVTFLIFPKLLAACRGSITDFSDANNAYDNFIVFLAYFMTSFS